MEQSTSGFYGLGIAPKILETLDKLKYVDPTPIQRQSIPVALEGKDVIGIAQTGTGKTLAYSIPAIQRIAKTGGRILIILPTRELALQVEETFAKLRQGIPLRTAVLIGGAAMRPQIDALRKSPHAIIVTPGRLIDHLEQRTVDLKDVSVLVLDEADRMLDMGFAPQINRILQTVPKERQTLLYSATMPQEIMHMAQRYMALPVRVEIAQQGTAADKVTQEIIFVKKEDKTRLLEKVLGEHRGTVLVFSRTKHGAHRIARSVKSMGHSSAEIHSDRSLNQRREALDGFKSGKYRVLIATDIAARGIDVKGIELVINFDLPDHTEDYVHRIGRTGRAGMSGHAISFAQPEQSRDVRDIERLMRINLPVSKLPELPPHRVVKMSDIMQRAETANRSYGSGGSSSGRSYGSGRPSYPRATPAGHGAPRSSSGPRDATSSDLGYYDEKPPSREPSGFGRGASRGGSGRPGGAGRGPHRGGPGGGPRRSGGGSKFGRSKW